MVGYPAKAATIEADPYDFNNAPGHRRVLPQPSRTQNRFTQSSQVVLRYGWTGDVSERFEQTGVSEYIDGRVIEVKQIDAGRKKVFYNTLVLVEGLEVIVERLLHAFLPKCLNRPDSILFEILRSPSRRRDHSRSGDPRRISEAGMSSRSISRGSNFVRPPAYVRPS